MRGDRRDRDQGPTRFSTPVDPSEPTTMALALRKAMENAKKKQG